MSHKKILSLVASCFVLLFITTHAYANETVQVKNVLDVLTADLNKDGFFDRIALVHPDDDDDVSLYVYLSATDNTMKLAAYKKNFVWSGALWGTTPSLSINKADSLIVQSQNEAIGRNRWIKKMTISYRNKQLVVSGYSYDTYDTLDLNNKMSCDVNLLTGKGIKNGKKFKVAAKKTPLADWTENNVPEQCRDE